MKVSPGIDEKPRTRENMPYQVSPVDDRLEGGPIEDRSCTDILCCLLFIIFLVALVGIGLTALSEGASNIKYINSLYDSDGFACGISGTGTNATSNVSQTYDFSNYPYLYYPRPTTIGARVCVQSCPTYDANGNLPSALICAQNSQVQTCSMPSLTSSSLSASSIWGTLTTGQSLANNISNSYFLIYNTTTYLSSFCFPADVSFWSCSNCSSMISSIIGGYDRFNQWAADMRLSWPLLFAVGAIAVGVAMLFMVFMRYCAGFVTWIMIWGFLICLGAMGYVCYYKYKLLKNGDGLSSGTVTTTASQTVDSTSNNQTDTQNILLAFAIAFWVADVVGFIILCCIYHKIQLAIAVMKAGADFMKQTLSVLTVPFIILALIILYLAYWFAVFICMFAMGASYSAGTLPFTSVNWTKPQKYMVIYHAFAFLWVLAFFQALTQFVIGSTVAIWYYAQGPDSQGAHRPVSRSFYRAIRYHLGSLAFGSLIVAIVQAIRIVMLYIQKQMKDAHITDNNKFVEYIFICVNCCLECFERFIRFINKNAYIQIAIRGSNFCQAARDAFFMIWQNAIRFTILAGIGEIYLFVGQIIITVATTCIGYAMVISIYSSKLNSPILPTVFYFGISLVISMMFMSIYGMACDTILQCFCVDEETQKAKGSDPKHCPEPLRDLFDRVEKKK